MKYLLLFCLVNSSLFYSRAAAQDSTGLAGTPFQEVKLSPGETSPYLFNDWYMGTVRTSDDKVHDGIQLRYDLKKDEVEYKQNSGLYRLSQGVTEFTIPTGTDLYIFKSGFPAADGQTGNSFYRVLYEGNTVLLKKYTSPIRVEKASATTAMDQDSKLYILKDQKLTPVKLSDKNSFLKLLSDEKNKMLYTIKEQQLDFGAEDDLISLLEEYDSFKAGRGGN
jgi:hypothetical protein